MGKAEDHLFDELINALETMSREAQDSVEEEKPQRKALNKAIASWRRGRRILRKKRHGMQRFLRAGSSSAQDSASALAGRARVAFAPLADIRIVVRMIILFVIAGTGTLLLVTRPFTSGQADARMSSNAAAVVAQTHTELERVHLRGVGQPAWSPSERTFPVEPAPVEPLATQVEELPTRTAELGTRYVQTEIVRIDPIAPESAPIEIELSQPEATTPGTGTPGATVDPTLEALYQRGMRFKDRNDFAAARLVFKRAADRGHAAAAFALGESYDPIVYKNRTYGVEMNAELARKFYEKARQLGFEAAESRLNALATAQ